MAILAKARDSNLYRRGYYHEMALVMQRCCIAGHSRELASASMARQLGAVALLGPNRGSAVILPAPEADLG